jgi:hypothetical protein
MMGLLEDAPSNQVDAQILARTLSCSECTSPVEAHVARVNGTKVWVARCVLSRGQHALLPKRNAAQVYRETGVGDAITRQNVERQDLKRARKQKEAQR